MQIGNKEPVPGSLLTIIGFILVSVFFLFHQHVRHKMILKINVICLHIMNTVRFVSKEHILI